MDDLKVVIVGSPSGEKVIESMDEDSRLEIGRKTMRFFWRVMMNPVYRQMVKDKVAQMRAEGDPLILEAAAKDAADREALAAEIAALVAGG